MKFAKPSACKKCKRVTMTFNEVWLCPYCGTSNVCYSHIVDDVGKGINFLLKTSKK